MVNYVHNYASISNPGFAFKANVARLPCSYAIVPAAAIIAALSVHKDSGGIISSMFSFLQILLLIGHEVLY